jgi:hypothetical protein
MLPLKPCVICNDDGVCINYLPLMTSLSAARKWLFRTSHTLFKLKVYMVYKGIHTYMDTWYTKVYIHIWIHGIQRYPYIGTCMHTWSTKVCIHGIYTCMYTNDFLVVRHLPTEIGLVLSLSKGVIQHRKVLSDTKSIRLVNTP